MLYEVLYYRDTADRLRSWQVEVEGNSYRVISGLVDGKKVTSKWKTAKPKNVGKKNATTANEQAHAETKALYEKARKQGCAEKVEDITVPYITPMLAAKMKDRKKPLPFESSKIWVQPKYDGFRCLITTERMHSRTGETFLNCEHIYGKLRAFLSKHSKVIKALDGELYNHEYHDNFNKLSSLITKEEVTFLELEEIEAKVQFHCYDFVPQDPEMSYESRIKYLNENLPTAYNEVKLVPTTPVHSFEQIAELKEKFIEDGYEGTMIRIDGPYELKRSKNLIKYKRLEDAEFEIDEILEGQGNWSGVAKSVVVKLQNKADTCKAGIRGNLEFCAQLLKDAEYWKGKKCTVEFDGYTPDGMLRFPIVTKWHHGKIEKR